MILLFNIHILIVKRNILSLNILRELNLIFKDIKTSLVVKDIKRDEFKVQKNYIILKHKSKKLFFYLETNNSYFFYN